MLVASCAGRAARSGGNGAVMAAGEAGGAATGDGLLTVKFDNKAPIALEDLTASLNALAQSYEDYVAATGEASPEAGVKLYVHNLRTGTITAVLQAIADQGHLLFGEHGVVPAVQSAFEHADTIGGFIVSLNDVIQFFLGNQDKNQPSKKEAEQVVKILEPIAKDNGSQLTVGFGGSVAIHGPAFLGPVHFHYTSQEANAAQNSARRYLGPTLPSNRTLRDELLTLHQVRGDTKARSGDKGIIESISKTPVKLLFSSEDIKKGILDSPDNPFQRVFVVDVDVKTVDGKPALYKVLALKDSFDRP
jgi:hypothetical protein